MKFVLLVEGDVERIALPPFLKRWLDARAPEPVGIKVIQFEGFSRYVADVAKVVKRLFEGQSGHDVLAAIVILDLYGPSFYPKSMDAPAKIEWVTRKIVVEVGNPRFRQHFALHDLEAWLLADPAIFPRSVRSALPTRCAKPETVDLDEPPSKLLGRLYRRHERRSYRKTIDGPDLFRRLSPETAYGKCPALKRLLDDMLAFAEGRLP